MKNKIIEFVTKNPNKHTYQHLAERFSIPRNSVNGIIGRAALNHLIVKEQGGPRSTQEHIMVTKTKKTLTAGAWLSLKPRKSVC